MAVSNLASPNKSLRDSSVPSTRACGDEVSHTTALQQGAHVFSIEVESNKVPHF